MYDWKVVEYVEVSSCPFCGHEDVFEHRSDGWYRCYVCGEFKTPQGIEVRIVSEKPPVFAATTEKIAPMYCLGATALEAESKVIAADKAAWSRSESDG